MKILRLRTYTYPERVGATAMGDDLDAAFEKNDIVSVNITPIPSRGISDEVRKAYKHIRYEELRNGHVIIHRFPMFKEGTNAFRKALRYFLSTVVEYFKGIGIKDVDLVYVSSTPPTQGLLGAKVARKLSKKYGRKVPVVYNLQDVFPDSLVYAGLTKKGSALWKAGRKIEDKTYRYADKIIVISEDMKRNIMAKGVPEEKIVVIPNWADTGNIHSVSREDNPLFDTYCLPRDKFYISYIGTIGHLQNIGHLLDVAKMLKDELTQVRFVLIGDGAARTDVERRVKEENIDNVILLPYQPYDQMANAFSLGDVSLIICKPGVSGSSLPSKTWNIMAAERPILASFDSHSAVASLIKEIGCGVIAEAGNREQLAGAVRDLYYDNNLAEKGRLGKAYLVTALDKDKCVKRYINELYNAAELSNFPVSCSEWF